MDKEYKKPSKNQKKSSMYDLMNRNNLRNVHLSGRGAILSHAQNTIYHTKHKKLYIKTDANPHTGGYVCFALKHRITLPGSWL